MTSYFLSCSFFLQCNDFLEYFFPCFQIKLVFLDSQEVNIKGCQGLNFFQISHNDFSGSEVPPKTEFSILSHFQGIQTDSLLNLTILILLFLNHLQVYFQNIYSFIWFQVCGKQLLRF